MLLVFVDGVGIGADDPAANPFAAARLPRLRGLLGGRLPLREQMDGGGHIVAPGAVLAATDARLGVAGRPQSGTGQTALLTGVNAPAGFGRHFGAWVPTGLRPVLAAESLLARAVRAGRSAAFANAYPIHRFGLDVFVGRRPAAAPLAAHAAGLLGRDREELRAGRAVASSITNERWRAELGVEVPDVTAGEAGRNLAGIAAEHEVTLFAHYDTDAAGHRGDLAAGVAALERVDAFLGGVVDALPADALLVVASDHGNLEDVAGGHTLNPVPTLAAGRGREALAERVRDLTHVTPALLELLGIG
ncbi:MAG TPA: alkaline phosphatase family protein [Longimicrobiaceae bacterium]|nr:alkaline phosphatase family protein [Longimicrobiaceae bacterium]